VHDLAEVALSCQLNDHMKVIGQENISQKHKEMDFFDIPQNFPQQVYICCFLEGTTTFMHNLCNENR
jgi:hypothetical protein